MVAMLRQHLKQILEDEDKSRYYLWKELGINQGLLSSFFKGDKNVSLKNFERIVDKLGYEILLFKKSAIGRTLHQEKVAEMAKIAEKEIERIIEKFETSGDVYVRGITVGAGKVKIDYGKGRIGAVSTKGRNQPDSEKP
jgi:hypothetical protein